jgi:hypothetical protein
VIINKQKKMAVTYWHCKRDWPTEDAMGQIQCSLCPEFRHRWE